MSRRRLRALDALTSVGTVRDAADAAVHNAVTSARDAGASWSEVGRALGITKTEARDQHQRGKGAVYVDEESLIRLAVMADSWGCDLATALGRALGAYSRRHPELAGDSAADARTRSWE